MGSYAALSIGGYELFQTKSYVDPLAMSVFTERDRIARLVPDHGQAVERASAIPGTWKRADLLELADDVLVDIRYRASAAAVAERLDVMAISLARVRDGFERRLRERADDIADALEDETVSRSAVAQMLREATFSDWSTAFQEFMASDLHPGWPSLAPASLRTEMMRYIDAEADEAFFGLPGDARWLLRAAVEVLGPDAVVEYDIGELVRSGWYELQQPIAAEANRDLQAAARANAPVIVLTEGSSDAAALRLALQVLSPHLIGYVTFYDFHGMNAAGGAGSLAATVRAIAAAGVVNRTIAVFDNDTAGRDAIRSLSSAALPESLCVITLPELELARAYPTRGPQGESTQDVNGLAASLEMYFGEDVLRDPEGHLTPVEWSNLDRGMGAWHGALQRKGQLQERFVDKVRRAAKEPELLESLDWAGMRLIIDRLVHAFDRTDASPDVRSRSESGL